MKLNEKHWNSLLEGIRFLFILLFFFAGLTKLLEGPSFYTNLLNAPIFGGEAIATVASQTIPFAEVLVALLLCWSKTHLAGLYGALGLFLLFAGYAGGILFFTPYKPCPCGGIVTLLSWEQHLVLHGVGVLLVLWTLVEEHRKRKCK
jgi:hypothetical protein